MSNARFLSPFFLLYTATLISSQTAGTLDTTFNAAGAQPGTLATKLGGFYSNSITYNPAQLVAIQTDGKIVMGGTVNNGTYSCLALGRFNTNGTLDTTGFNPTGTQPGTIALPVIHTANSFANALAIQSDGKIIIVGYASDGTNTDFAIARLTTSGALDTTFNAAGTGSGIPGIVVTQIGSSTNSQANGVAIQPNGQIVVAGITNTTTIQGAVARYNTNGSLDTSFGTNGTYVLPIINSEPCYIYGVALQANGSIVLGGYAYFNSENNVAAARLTTNGVLDTTFNAAGTNSNLPGVAITTIAGATYSYGYTVGIQSNGTIVVGGLFYDDYGIAIACFNPNGTLDTSFNPTGVKPGTAQGFINNSLYNYSNAYGMAIQNDNKIVVAGYAYPTPAITEQFGIARIDTNGTMDPLFNPQAVIPGSNSTNINNFSNQAVASGVALQKNGSIVVSGTASDGTHNWFALARFNGLITNNAYALSLINGYALIG